MKHREFTYVGDAGLEINEQECEEFLMNIQKSILVSLERRKLLTSSQRERCFAELEKQYIQAHKSGRQV